MKMLLIFTIYLISGPVGHSKVIGYSGGRVVINSTLKWHVDDTKYICKMRQNHCDYIIRRSSKSPNMYTERFMLFTNLQGIVVVLITNLKLQDAGTYRIGIENKGHRDVNLDVEPPIDRGPKIMTAYRGQNISIICNFTVENKDKFLYKEDSDNLVKDIRDIAAKSLSSRFSTSANATVLSVNINDVRDTDGGVYLCGVMNNDQQLKYYSFFPDRLVQIKAKQSPDSSVIISVCFCVAVLFIGGFALMIYIKIYKRTQGVSSCSSKKRLINNKQEPPVYENNQANLPKYENLNVIMSLYHQNLDSCTSQSDSVYQKLDPLTNQSDSGYASLTNFIKQAQSHYQCLNPGTQSHSIYHTLHS